MNEPLMHKRLLAEASDLTSMGVEVILTWYVGKKKWVMEVIGKNGYSS